MNCIVCLVFLVGWAKMTRFAASAFECILSGLQFFGVWIFPDLCRVHLKASSWRVFASLRSTIVRFFEVVSLTDWILFQVRDWPREAGGAEWSGSADPADSGTGEMAERDDGAEIQAVHGRWWGGNVQIQQLCPLERLKKLRKSRNVCVLVTKDIPVVKSERKQQD